MRDKIELVALTTSDQAWQILTRVANEAASNAPSVARWAALDAKLPGKSSRVKVAVQALCLRLLRFRDPRMDEWLLQSVVAARGAHALFLDGTEHRNGLVYQPFDFVATGRSSVRPEARQHTWHAGVQALHAMVECEAAFASLTPVELGGLFLLSHTSDHMPAQMESFDEEFWWVRVLHLSLSRNVNLRVNAFALAPAAPRRRVDGETPAAAGELLHLRTLATRQLASAIALKVAIFYKKRHRDAPSAPGVSRHALEEVKRACLKLPRAPKPARAPAAGVTDCVRAAMLAAALRQRVPVSVALQRASIERMALSARIRRLDLFACAHAAWRRASKAERDALAATGLPLHRSDSVWQDVGQLAVRKLVAVGAGADWQPRVVHARPEAATAKAARAEMASLVERLLALLALEFRLREECQATHAALPLELQQQGDLPVRNDPPCGTVPAHVDAYARALRAQHGAHAGTSTFAAAVTRAVARAIRGAFFGCLRLASSTSTAVADVAPTEPRVRAALDVVNRVLSIAARHHALVAHDCDEEGVVAIAVYNREAQTFSMPGIERVVEHNWPAARALADLATECESWVRDARKAPPLSAPEEASWWVGIGASGLAIHHERKADTLARLDDAEAASHWWHEWPPTRDAVLAREESVVTAIAWGGKTTAAFFGVPQPDQYIGCSPFG